MYVDIRPDRRWQCKCAEVRVRDVSKGAVNRGMVQWADLEPDLVRSRILVNGVEAAKDVGVPIVWVDSMLLVKEGGRG